MRSLSALTLVATLCLCSCEASNDSNSDANGNTNLDAVGQDLPEGVDAKEPEDPGSVIGSDNSQLPNGTDQLVAAMYNAAVACGYQSKSTVPVGWQNTIATNAGCSLWYPGGWQLAGQPDNQFIIDSQANNAGYFVTIGALQGVNWDLKSVTQEFYNSITKNVGSTPVQKHYKEYNILGVNVADVVFAYTENGQGRAAFMRVYFTGPNYILNTTSIAILGFYMYDAQINKYMCLLTQIDASLQCPGGGGGGGCSDSDCNESCVNDGNSGGQCVGDDCSCY